MAVIIPGKLVYLATPHTASKATTNALMTIDGAFITNMSHHAPKSETLPHVSGGEVFVTTVRNPYDLLVTWYLRRRMIVELRRKSSISFEEFLRTVDQNVAFSHIQDMKMFWHDVDEYLRYENLQDDLNALLVRLNLPKVTIEQYNVTQGKQPWPKYHNEETKKLIETRFGAELKKFGYEFLVNAE